MIIIFASGYMDICLTLARQYSVSGIKKKIRHLASDSPAWEEQPSAIQPPYECSELSFTSVAKSSSKHYSFSCQTTPFCKFPNFTRQRARCKLCSSPTWIWPSWNKRREEKRINCHPHSLQAGNKIQLFYLCIFISL